MPNRAILIVMDDRAKPDEDGRVLLEEHVTSRKDWGRYVELVTEVRRSVVSDADEFLADMRTRIQEALQRTANERGE